MRAPLHRWEIATQGAYDTPHTLAGITDRANSSTTASLYLAKPTAKPRVAHGLSVILYHGAYLILAPDENDHILRTGDGCIKKIAREQHFGGRAQGNDHDRIL